MLWRIASTSFAERRGDSAACGGATVEAQVVGSVALPVCAVVSAGEDHPFVRNAALIEDLMQQLGPANPRIVLANIDPDLQSLE